MFSNRGGTFILGGRDYHNFPFCSWLNPEFPYVSSFLLVNLMAAHCCVITMTPSEAAALVALQRAKMRQGAGSRMTVRQWDGKISRQMRRKWWTMMKHDWLVVWNINFIFPYNIIYISCIYILGISSFQLTFIFFRGVGQPPTRWWNMLGNMMKHERKNDEQVWPLVKLWWNCD